MGSHTKILLPLREKVARACGSDEGSHRPLWASVARLARRSATPHPSATPTPSPARGEGYRLVAAVVLSVAAFGLAGCGFTPLYSAPGVVSNLAAIDVVAPQGRAGFLIRQHLDD